ncbi:MAG: CPBP family intramembrane metalloprotease [Microbacterium sp.]|uniref:CPBP family intramembrane glutamic endopeptidase n=1 Tax=Microbacterium sp. TaxID=51671 RepID=UPI001AC5EC38|nr:type II CAAX endopeptidase family protein [Microbacterium sp.]MBN9178870.1 CPBP family intramembrane metalloprotease [Microbacterium sp.]
MPAPAPAPAPVLVHVPAPAAAPLPADATSGGLAFHRLVFARRRRGWWTPLVVGALGIAFYLVLMLVVLVAIFAAASVDPTVLERMTALAQNPTIDARDPLMLALLLGTIVLMLPCYQLASLIVNGKRVGLISSAAGRLRWRWMLLCGLVALVLYGVFTLVSLVLPSEITGDAAGDAAPQPLWPLSLALILLLVPLQSAAEEYVFRGYLAQAIGRWLRHPAFAILLPVPLFVLGHLYDVLGQLSVGVFAVAAGWLVWRTGGLEAAIALHVVNNLSGFLLSLASGADPTASETGWVSFVSSFVLIGGYVAIVEWLLRRRAARGRPLPRTLVLTPPVPVPAHAAARPSASRIV